MPIGPRSELPSVLSKTWSPSLTIWTYCVDPTSPFVSGGAQLQLTPGNGIPSKFRPGAGMFFAGILVWTAESLRFVCWWTIGGVLIAWCDDAGVTGFGVMLRSFGEVSFFVECPTWTLLPVPLSARPPDFAARARPFATAGEKDFFLEPDDVAATATPAVRARTRPTSASFVSVPLPQLDHRSMPHSFRRRL